MWKIYCILCQFPTNVKGFCVINKIDIYSNVCSIRYFLYEIGVLSTFHIMGWGLIRWGIDRWCFVLWGFVGWV